MKKSIFILTIMVMTCFISWGQDTEEERVELPGKVNVTRDKDPQGLDVINKNSHEYTFTDAYGRFKIPVKENDTLEFAGIQFRKFAVIITKEVIDKGEIVVNVSGEGQELKEVVLRPGLTGDINVDLDKIKTPGVNMGVNISRSDILNGTLTDSLPNYMVAPENRALNMGYLKNGLNFVNIFKAIFMNKTGAEHKSSPLKDIDVEIRKLYEDDFFKKNLNLKPEEINRFIFFMEDRGLTPQEVRDSNDLDLIQYILKERKAYKTEAEES